MKTLKSLMLTTVVGVALSGCAEDSDAMLLFHAQRAAEDAWAYTMGAEALAPDDAALRARLLELRAAVASDQTRIHYNTFATVRGQRCAIYEVYGRSELHDDVADLVDEIAAALAQTTPLADEFFAATEGTIVIDGRTVSLRGIDPPIAVTTADLAGITGSRAVAFDVSRLTPTTVHAWPSAWVECRGACPAAAAPCSTTELPSGSAATQTIQQDGTRFRCL